MIFVGLAAVGLAAGVISSVLGVGGGVVFVPALAILFAFDQHLAQGTSLAVIVPTTIVGAMAHAREGRVLWGLVIPISAGGILGGVAGAQLALTLEADLLRRLFAAFLAVIAIRMLIRTFRGRDSEA
ncbi:MAG: sulfite exporter TauE/SafE family protein [Actinomycetota bacterium]|nr:sulfite exporter TauE/SafE family protein [Actinomycetota bacterium]